MALRMPCLRELGGRLIGRPRAVPFGLPESGATASGEACAPSASAQAARTSGSASPRARARAGTARGAGMAFETSHAAMRRRASRSPSHCIATSVAAGMRSLTADCAPASLTSASGSAIALSTSGAALEAPSVDSSLAAARRAAGSGDESPRSTRSGTSGQTSPLPELDRLTNVTRSPTRTAARTRQTVARSGQVKPERRRANQWTPRAMAAARLQAHEGASGTT